MAAFPAPIGAPKPKSTTAKKKVNPLKAVHALIAKKIKKTAMAAERLADRGNPKAQVLLAKMYISGQEISQNDSMAAHWNMKAARKNNSEGLYQVATTFETGRGVPTSIKEAVKYYEVAAKQGYREAQISLGKIHAGWQLDYRRDVIKERKWLLLATGQGSFKAASLLDKLEATYQFEPKATPSTGPAAPTAVQSSAQPSDRTVEKPNTKMAGKAPAATPTKGPSEKTEASTASQKLVELQLDPLKTVSASCSR